MAAGGGADRPSGPRQEWAAGRRQDRLAAPTPAALMAASGAGRPDAATIADAPPGQNLSGPPVSGRGPLKLSYPPRSQPDSPVQARAGRLARRSPVSSPGDERGGA